MSKSVLVMETPKDCMWCSLMKLPEKDNGCYPINTFDAGHAEGWNTCIDEIAGGE